jgi:hypothetical protein
MSKTYALCVSPDSFRVLKSHRIPGYLLQDSQGNLFLATRIVKADNVEQATQMIMSEYWSCFVDSGVEKQPRHVLVNEIETLKLPLDIVENIVWVKSMGELWSPDWLLLCVSE